MKRVLFVDHVDRVLGGAEINLIELIEEAQRHGHWQIAVACRRRSRLGDAVAGLDVQQFEYGFPESLNALRFTGKTFPWTRLWNGWRALRHGATKLREIEANFAPHRVISCTNKDHFAVSRANIDSARRICWINDLITPDFFPMPTRYAFGAVAKNAGRLVAVSNAVAKALVALNIPARRISVIHNGIPLHKYRETGSPRGTFRAQWGFSLNDPLFGVVGRICEWKGQSLFLEIAQRWIEAGLPGNFVIVGNAFNEDQWFELALRATIENLSTGPLQNSAAAAMRARVRIVPFQQNVAEVLADLDALLHTSGKPEPFGRVLIEAMAAGTPVIAANAGGATEIIKPNTTGLLAAPQNSQDYFEKLREIMQDQPHRAQLIEAARKSVEKHFTVERVYREFDAIINM